MKFQISNAEQISVVGHVSLVVEAGAKIIVVVEVVRELQPQMESHLVGCVGAHIILQRTAHTATKPVSQKPVSLDKIKHIAWFQMSSQTS
jgi:hypothetical protein